MKRQNGLLLHLILFFPASIFAGHAPFPLKASMRNQHNITANAEPTKATPSAENWSENDIKNLLKNTPAVEICANFSLSIKGELEKMRNHIEWIRDLFNEIQGKLNTSSQDIRSQLTILGKDIELMASYYKDCFDELNHSQSNSGSVYVNCIEHLKKLQTAVQYLRNSVDNILTAVRLLAAKNGKGPAYQGLRSSKREIKVIDDHCIAMNAVIDQIFAGLLPILRVYHERSFEERGRGQYTRPSRLGL